MRIVASFACGLLLAVSLFAQDAKVSGTVGITENGKAVKDRSGAVVWLVPIGRSVALAQATHVYRLQQKDKHFDPHLLVVPQGAQVEFPNRDPFFHNVFSLHDGVRFDLGLYEGGATKTVRFSRPGASYIFCNIHPEMSAVILVMSSPYYAATNSDGVYEIAGVPEGDYQLSLWYERAQAEELKSLSRKITVTGATKQIEALAIQMAPGIAEHHKNKYGQDYEASPTYKVP